MAELSYAVARRPPRRQIYLWTERGCVGVTHVPKFIVEAEKKIERSDAFQVPLSPGELTCPPPLTYTRNVVKEITRDKRVGKR